MCSLFWGAFLITNYIFSEVGARNERRVCAVNCNKNAGFEVVHGLLDKIMVLLEVPWNPNATAGGYYLEATEGKLQNDKGI